MEEKIEKALGLFNRLDEFGRALTSRQVGGIAYPAGGPEVRGALLQFAVNNGEEALDIVIDDMEFELSPPESDVDLSEVIAKP